MKLVYVGFAFRHHKGTEAGYHHIKEYLKYDKIVDCQWEWDWLTSNSSSLFLRDIHRFYCKYLGDGLILTILRCILIAVFCKNQVFHFIYAENTYKYLHHFIGKTNKIVCTYHQPVDVIKKNQGWLNDILRVDKVILMSAKDIDWIKQLTGKDNVYFIPHGINTDFFSPDENVKRRHDILMIGNWLRDFEFANSVFEFLLDECADIKITVVTDEINHNYFNQNERLKLLTGISDEMLRDLYRTSCCLFLPLKSYSANNSILEAAATGCPIVVATDNMDVSYFSPQQIDFLPLKKELVCSHLKNMVDSKYDFSKAEVIRQFVTDNYSWPIVAGKTNEILRDR